MDPQKFLKTMKPVSMALFCLKNIGHLWDGIILAKEDIRGVDFGHMKVQISRLSSLIVELYTALSKTTPTKCVR